MTWRRLITSEGCRAPASESLHFPKYCRWILTFSKILTVIKFCLESSSVTHLGPFWLWRFGCLFPNHLVSIASRSTQWHNLAFSSDLGTEAADLCIFSRAWIPSRTGLLICYEWIEEGSPPGAREGSKVSLPLSRGPWCAYCCILDVRGIVLPRRCQLPILTSPPRCYLANLAFHHQRASVESRLLTPRLSSWC